MKDKPKNPQAYPSHDIDYRASAELERNVVQNHHQGMTLRDYFAAKAMKALITTNFITNKDGFQDVRYDYDEIAIEAERYADAMLEARNK